ncbi:MAG: hypothetical protein PF961_18595 [Planctomycetota bacterium]|jgi:hypothetical protein|nr:hypothetical protein [Planctomycetota bacterium]
MKAIIISGLILILIAGGMLLVMGSGDGELAGWDQFPRTYIAVQDTGYDPGRLIIVPARRDDLPSIERDGVTYYRAYTHPDVPMAQGYPLIFPLMGGGENAHTPPLPPTGKPLTAAQVATVNRYHTEEGQRLLKQFADSFQP